jgi:WD40 repeat protein
MSGSATEDTESGQSPRTFGVFLSYSGADKALVTRLAKRLKQAGLEPWLDDWELPAGGRFQDGLADGLEASRSCAVLVGASDLGAWENEEVHVAVDRAAKDRSFRVFLVLLPGIPDPFDPTRLPPFLRMRTWVDLRDGLNRVEHEFERAIAGLGPGPDEPIEADSSVCPYRGLRTFDEEHADLFFGREADVQRLLEKLKAAPFVAVLGPSGSGKSSLVRAGLVPAIRRDMLPGSDTWSVCILRPGPHPLSALAAQLVQLAPGDAMQKTVDGLLDDPRTLQLAIALALADAEPEKRVLLVVDQAEELFTLARDEAERAAFLDNVLYGASVPDGGLRLVFTMRADFYARAAAYPTFAEQMAAHQYLVGPLDEDGLCRAIEEPARLVGLEFEPGLVRTILEDVEREPGALPLLEHALAELWERRRGHLLTLEGYRESGGVEGAIAKRADHIYDELDEPQRELVRRTLLRLTQPGEGAEDTRRRAPISELASRREEQTSVDDIVRALVDARLLTTSTDADSGQECVDVAHEALIRSWQRLRGWVEEDRAGLLVHRHVTEAADEWQRHGRRDDDLYRGRRLADALVWREHDEEALNELERAFLDASVAFEERERLRELRNAKRFRNASFALFALLIVAILAAVAAFVARGQAKKESKRSTSSALAAQSLLQLTRNPERALALAVDAAGKAHTTDAENALRQALSASRVTAVLRPPRGDAVAAAAFSPDGRLVATGESNGNVYLWNAKTGARVATLRGHTRIVFALDFGRKGDRLVTASRDHTARIWNVRSRKTVAVLRGHKAALSDVELSRDERRVLTTSFDQTARIWNASSGKPEAVLRVHSGGVEGGSFDPAGRLVVTAGDDRTARLWTVKGRRIAVLRGHDGPVLSASFSPNGKHVLTTGSDGTARLWSAAGRPGPVLRDGAVGAVAAAFSPDSRDVVTGGQSAVARLWNAASGNQEHALGRHGNAIEAVAYSPDGRSVVTASDDSTARVWDVSDGSSIVLRGHGAGVTRAAFDASGEVVLTASADTTARLWRPTGALAVLRHGAQVQAAALSPDGRFAATAGTDQKVGLWDVGTAKRWRLLPQPAPPSAVAFNPRGDVLASAGPAGIRLWAVPSGRSLATLGSAPGFWAVGFGEDGHEIAAAGQSGTVSVWRLPGAKRVFARQVDGSAATAVAFSADGRLLIAGSERGNLVAWSLSSGSQRAHFRFLGPVLSLALVSDDAVALVDGAGYATIRPFSQRERPRRIDNEGGPASAVAVSRDGRFIALAHRDGTVSVSDVTGTRLTEFAGHHGEVSRVSFGPGTELVTASADGTARIYTCDVCGSFEELIKAGEDRLRTAGPGQQ